MELLEREPFLAELEAALADVSAGSGRLILVRGEAGIGKTMLVDAFTRSHQKKVRVLWGACDLLFTPHPLGPLHDIAAQLQGDLLYQLNSRTNRSTIFSTFISELQLLLIWQPRMGKTMQVTICESIPAEVEQLIA